MTDTNVPRRRPRAGTIVFFTFISGSAASLVPLHHDIAPELLLIVLAACPLTAALLAPSLFGVYLIPLLGTVSGLCASAYLAAAGLSSLPPLCLLVPLLFVAAAAGMELSGRVRSCCTAAKFRVGFRRNKILLYLSATGSLISAYFIFR